MAGATLTTTGVQCSLLLASADSSAVLITSMPAAPAPVRPRLLSSPAPTTPSAQPLRTHGLGDGDAAQVADLEPLHQVTFGCRKLHCRDQSKKGAAGGPACTRTGGLGCTRVHPALWLAPPSTVPLPLYHPNGQHLHLQGLWPTLGPTACPPWLTRAHKAAQNLPSRSPAQPLRSPGAGDTPPWKGISTILE